MATTTKLTATNGYYGHSGNGSYTNTDNGIHLYAGQSSGTSSYRSRLKFAALDVGKSRIRITSMKLYLRRNEGGATKITIGCSTSANWGAELAATASGTLGDETKWYSFDISALGDAVAGYTSAWYLHIAGETPRVRFSGTGSSWKPYLKITWEYVAATISGDQDSAELGTDAVTFTIAPEVDGETHTLTYSLGNSGGTIATNAGNSIQWTPPLALAAELPKDTSGTVTVNLTAYDSSGSVQRTEVYYQTVSVPESVKPSATVGASMLDALAGYGLYGRTRLSLAPTVDMNGAYGATLEEVRVSVSDGQGVEWMATTESEPGVFTCAAATTTTIDAVGTVTATVYATDSRGRTATSVQSFAFCAYSAPAISTFQVQRCTPIYDENEEITDQFEASDLGEYVWVDLAVSAASVAPNGTQLNALKWTISGVCSETGETLSASGGSGQSSTLTQDRAVFPSAVSGEETWVFTLKVTDTAGVSAMQYSTVGIAQAALSISADRRGVAIGMIASGSKADPRFEVAKSMPAHFYGGAYDAQGREMIGGALNLSERIDTAESIATSTDTDIAIFTAEESGVYLATATVSWASNADGVRTLMLCDASGEPKSISRFRAGGTGAIQQNACAIIPLESGESIVARVWQSSGSALNLNYRIVQVCRIAGR